MSTSKCVCELDPCICDTQEPPTEQKECTCSISQVHCQCGNGRMYDFPNSQVDLSKVQIIPINPTDTETKEICEDSFSENVEKALDEVDDFSKLPTFNTVDELMDDLDKPTETVEPSIIIHEKADNDYEGYDAFDYNYESHGTLLRNIWRKQGDKWEAYYDESTVLKLKAERDVYKKQFGIIHVAYADKEEEVFKLTQRIDTVEPIGTVEDYLNGQYHFCLNIKDYDGNLYSQATVTKLQAENQILTKQSEFYKRAMIQYKDMLGLIPDDLKETEISKLTQRIEELCDNNFVVKGLYKALKAEEDLQQQLTDEKAIKDKAVVLLVKHNCFLLNNGKTDVETFLASLKESK